MLLSSNLLALIKAFVKDQGNVMGYDMPVLDYTRGVWQTMYTYLDLSGKCNGFRLVIDE